jgi:putative transposase
VFFQHGDYSLYKSALHKASTEHECDVHAYVLMVNHVHLLITPRRERSLPLLMQSMGRDYVQRLNARYTRTGPLWQGRYKACLIQDDKYFLTCQRYIELNPVRAGIVAFPAEYPYSSYAHNALGTEDPVISQHPCYRSLHPESESRREAYRSLFSDEFSEKELLNIRRRTNACSFLGNERFKKQIEDMLGRAVATGKRGRPAKGQNA